MTIQVCYDIVRYDFSRAGEASSSIKKLLKQLGISSDVIKRVAVATYEAEMNIIIHSEGGIIELNIDPEKIKIVAKDTGPGIENIQKAMTEGFSTAPNEVRELGFGAGMGLPNIKRCSDIFDIESSLGESTTVTMIIKLN